MLFTDLQEQVGIDVDRWFTIQSAKQPHERATVCHAFKEWLKCAVAIGMMGAAEGEQSGDGRPC